MGNSVKIRKAPTAVDRPTPEIGRPTKLKPEVRLRFLTALRAGNYRNAACAYAGISLQTFYSWMRAGKEGTDPASVSFLEDVETAEHEAEASMVLLWRTHMRTDWRAIAAFLSTRHPERWNRQSRIELGTADGKPLQIEHAHVLDLTRLSDEDLLRLREIADRTQGQTIKIINPTGEEEEIVG